MLRKSPWNRERSSQALKPGLPEERKTLAERYTIDADEAASRAEHTALAQDDRQAEQAEREAREQARREAEADSRSRADEQARHAAQEQARRRTAEEQAARDAEEQSRREAERQVRLAAEERARRWVAEQQTPNEPPDEHETAADSGPLERAADNGAIPLYGWVQRSDPEPAAMPDWPRSLVRMKTEDQRGETPPG